MPLHHLSKTRELHKINPRIWVGLAFLLAMLLSFWPMWLRGDIPFPGDSVSAALNEPNTPVHNSYLRDASTQIYPFRVTAINEMRSGQLPLWNPYLFSGTPLLANGQSSAFQPLQWLGFVLPPLTVQVIIVVLQPLLAMLFMYWLLRTTRFSRPASTVGAIVFALAGSMAVWLEWGTMDMSFLFLPLLALAIERQSGGFKPGWLALGVAAIFLSTASGHLQVAGLAIAAGALYAVWVGWRDRARRISQLRFIGTITVLYIVGLLLSAINIWPFLAYLPESSRTVKYQAQLLPLRHLLAIVYQQYRDNPIRSSYGIGVAPNEISWHLGFAATILAGISFFKWRRAWPFLVACGFIALLILQHTRWLYQTIYNLLPFTRYAPPYRILFVFVFCVAILAAYGAQTVIKRRWGKPFVVTALIISIVELGLYVSHFNTFVPPKGIYSQTDITRTLQQAEPGERIISERQGLDIYSPFNVASVVGYDSLVPKRYAELLLKASATVVKPNPLGIEEVNQTLLNFLNVRYIVTQRDLSMQSGLSLVADAYGRRVFENSSRAGKQLIPLSTVRTMSDTDTIAAIADGKVDIMKELILPAGAQYPATKITSSNDVKINQTTENTFNVSTSDDVWLARSVSWLPGWTVTIDSQPAELVRADYAFQAVFVPTGTHTIVFAYDPPSVMLSGWISLAGALLFACILVFYIRIRVRSGRSVKYSESTPTEAG